jgi:hypothetical protein
MKRENYTRTRPREVEGLRNKIQELFLAGKSVSEIGRVCQKDHSSILYHLNTLGLKRKHHRGEEAHKSLKITTHESDGRVYGRTYSELATRAYGRIHKENL